MIYDIPVPIHLGSGDTGLTLKIQRLDKVTALPVGSPITTGFVEIGGGDYQWAPFDVPAGFVGGLKVLDSSDNKKATGYFNAAEYELTAARVANLDNLDEAISDIPGGGGGGSTVSNAVAPGDDMYLIIGDSYLDDDGRAFQFIDTKGEWADFETAQFFAQDEEGIDCEVLDNEAGPGRRVRLELTSDETAALTAKKTTWAVRATDSDDHVFTISQGRLITKEAFG